jgi:hypothetical protein
MLSVFTLLASVVLLVLLLTSVTDDDSNGAAPPTDEPTMTEDPTDAPTDGPPASPSPTRRPSPTPTPDVLVPPAPEGDLSLGLWANELDAWWFGDLPEDGAIYHPGDEVPWLARWTAAPGASYSVSITYECRDGEAPLIDLLTGVEYAHDAIFLAEWGPGSTRPEAAVPVPDTADSEIDDNAPGLLYLYGGKFTLLPQGPLPGGPCTGERTITVPVEASGQMLLLMGSAWLAHPDDHGGDSAAGATSPIGLTVRVHGLGTAAAELSPDTVRP